MNKLIFGIIFGLLFSLNSFSTTVSKSLYIISDSLLTVDNNKAPYITFNETSSFTQNNPVINLMIDDTLKLWIYNTDSTQHSFEIEGVSSTMNIPAYDSIYFQYKFISSGVYVYHDPTNFPKNTYLGLAGMIVVKNQNHANFYWNIKEHNTSWNNLLFNNGTVNWNNYDPKYFTINSNSTPHINSDSLARVTASVGDTIYLHISNTGLSIHSIHLHGYHATITYSSKSSSHIGREKDTFSIYPMETLSLKIVPDKAGEYPIHNHNLIAITANNIYPNGMLTTILITP